MRFRLKKSYYRCFSLILVIVMVLISIPVSVSAQDYNGTFGEVVSETISDSFDQIEYTASVTQKSSEVIASDIAAMRAEQLIQRGIDPDATIQNNSGTGLVQSGVDSMATYAYSRTIDDGVYAISNIGNSNGEYTMYMDTNLSHWLPGYNMQQYKFSTAGSGNPAPYTPFENFETSALFKITRIPETGSYTIRIMRNNALSFGISQKADGSGLEVLTKYIPLDDSLVAYGDTYVIQESGTGLKIRKYGSTNCITAYEGQASGNAGKPNSFLYATSAISDQMRWVFTKYTGAERNDITMLGSGSLKAGTTSTLTPVFYSTRPGYNVISINMSQVPQASYTMSGPDLYGRFTVTPHSGTTWTIGIFAKNSSSDTAPRVMFGIYTWNISLPFKEGAYFLKNIKYQNKYVQINNNNDMTASGETIEMHPFYGYYYQRWDIIHVFDQYYKIISQYSDLALTAPTNSNDNLVTQTAYTNATAQRWKFIEQSDGTYKISPESNSNYFLAGGALSSNADQDVEIRTAQSDGSDKWMLRRITLEYWYSNINNVYLWKNTPSLYYEKIEGSSNFMFLSGVSEAKAQWGGALDMEFKSALENKADIKCYGASLSTFKDKGVNIGDNLLGLTYHSICEDEEIDLYYNGNLKKTYLAISAEIYILSKIENMSSTLQKTIIIHEFGHALGYDGHSSNSNDTMYASSTNMYLTDRDINHLAQFYNLSIN